MKSNNKTKNGLEPITIIRSQWRGVAAKRFYFIAFLHHFYDIPQGIGKSADFEKEFLHSVESNEYIYGVGTTPGNAMRNMYKDKKEKSLQPVIESWVDI